MLEKFLLVSDGLLQGSEVPLSCQKFLLAPKDSFLLEHAASMALFVDQNQPEFTF